MFIPSYWAKHASEGARTLKMGSGAHHLIEARRCTVQLSTGRLYLDAVASPSTALFGYDSPPLAATDEATVKGMLSALAPGYRCLAVTQSFISAAGFAARLGRWGTRGGARVAQINALEGEPTEDVDVVVAYENETLGRTGDWLASMAWGRTPDLVVIGETLALGLPFGAVLARNDFLRPRQLWSERARSATPAALERVAAAVAMVLREGLLAQGRDLANYLMARLLAMRANLPQIENIGGTGLSVRLGFAPPLRSTQIRRRMCERGVLTGVDAAGRLALDLPLAMRIAEIDVITGALRACILDLPLASASAWCAACRDGD